MLLDDSDIWFRDRLGINGGEGLDISRTVPLFEEVTVDHLDCSRLVRQNDSEVWVFRFYVFSLIGVDAGRDFRELPVSRAKPTIESPSDICGTFPLLGWA